MPGSRTEGRPIEAGSLSGRPQPHLDGPAVALRPWSDTDVDGLVAAYTDPQIQRWHSRSLDAEAAAALLARWRQGWTSETGASWAVVDAADARLLGRVGFRLMDLPESLAELAYWVLPSARRRGVATAAVTALRRWAFETVGFQRLELQHSVHNEASCGVAETTGFALEGTKRGCALHADGWHDMHLHARLRGDGPPAAPDGP